MARGDHIYVDRFGGVYSHHGIDCGDGTVIHYTSPNWSERRRIERTSLEQFARDDEIQVRDYASFEKILQQADPMEKAVAEAQRRWARLLDRLRGIAIDELDFSADAVLIRAKSRLGESRFDLVYNNCEHFAAWCKTGLSNSRQIDAVWRASMSRSSYMSRQAQLMLTRLID